MTDPESDFIPPTAPELDLDIGDAIHINSLLRVGGMGAVYQGEQVSLSCPIAVKVLQPVHDPDGHWHNSFQREAKAMARLDHHNIVSVYNFGTTTSGLHYFVMELVEGTNFYDLINNGAIPEKEVLKLIPQVCDGLQYAHGKDLVHRDIKPSNIMVSDDGVVKLTDFGLVRMSDQDQAGELAYGTPEYAAPEVFHSYDQVDQRGDIYSLGIVIFEMLTGSLPNIDQWVYPSAMNPDIHSDWDKVMAQTIQADPAQRYTDAQALKKQVNAIATGPAKPKLNTLARPATTRTPASGRITPAEPEKPKLALPLILLALLVTVGTFTWFSFRDTNSGLSDYSDQSQVKTEPVPTALTASEPDLKDPNIEKHSLVGTQWSGQSPFRNSKFRDIKIAFETTNRLRWSQSDGDHYMNYKLVGKRFQVDRKAPLIFERSKNGYLSVYVKVKGKPRIKKFTQIDP